MFSRLLTKIGNGLPLDDDEQQLIESRFYSKEDADRLYANGIRLFLKMCLLTNATVLFWISQSIRSFQSPQTSEGCRNAQQEVHVGQKLLKMSVIDTGGLPLEVTLFGYEVLVLGWSFQNHKRRVKNGGGRFLRSTFNEIVYGYDKTLSQQLVCVALSRVTSIEGLNIVIPNNDSTFHHGKRKATSTLSLQEEFRKLSLNRLVTVEEDMTNFISGRRGLSLFSLNCKSLSALVADFSDTVTQRTNILLLSESWLKNEDSFDFSNFECVCHFNSLMQELEKLQYTRILMMQLMSLLMRQTASLAVNASEIGEQVAAVITSIHKVSVLYTPEAAAVIGTDDDYLSWKL
ncbi:ATP-dependent DNA helicase [Trichonephila clavipes]|nr:ATP-dependent DNA helicase [Trichonephila clavipes]